MLHTARPSRTSSLGFVFFFRSDTEPCVQHYRRVRQWQCIVCAALERKGAKIGVVCRHPFAVKLLASVTASPLVKMRNFSEPQPFSRSATRRPFRTQPSRMTSSPTTDSIIDLAMLVYFPSGCFEAVWNLFSCLSLSFFYLHKCWIIKSILCVRYGMALECVLSSMGEKGGPWHCDRCCFFGVVSCACYGTGQFLSLLVQCSWRVQPKQLLWFGCCVMWCPAHSVTVATGTPRCCDVSTVHAVWVIGRCRWEAFMP